MESTDTHRFAVVQVEHCCLVACTLSVVATVWLLVVTASCCSKCFTGCCTGLPVLVAICVACCCLVVSTFSVVATMLLLVAAVFYWLRQC